jgi:hypothetical protein
MKFVRKPLLVIALFVLLFTVSSWGFLIHKTVQQLAVYELPNAIKPFFYQNMENLVYNSPRPDIRRNTDSTEATKHFIDLEAFGPNAANDMPLDWNLAIAKYGYDSLVKYGFVPYQVVHMKKKLEQAFKDKNKDSILFYAADIGHYIGDANVPLHTTINYDGQLTNQKGIHSLWESMIPEIEIVHYTSHTSHKASYLKHPDQAIWEAVRRAAILVPDMLAKEKLVSLEFSDAQKFRIQMRRGKESKSYTAEFAKAYSKALQSSINDQLIHSANLIADFYYTAWVDAGKPDLSSINTAFTKITKQKMKTEQKYYKNNALLTQKLLLSKKEATTESY